MWASSTYIFKAYLRINFSLNMLSAILSKKRSYVTLLLSKQSRHQRFPLPGPLVLGSAFFNFKRLW